MVEASWNVMAHTQKPDLVFQRNGWIHLNWRGRQFSRLLVAEVCASAVVMLVTPCSEVVWRVLATHSIFQFPLHFPSRASPCDITFQLHSNTGYTTFRGSVKSTGYPLHLPVSPSLPLPRVTVCHHISTGVKHLPTKWLSIPFRKI
jgi:hypothetical protein